MVSSSDSVRKLFCGKLLVADVKDRRAVVARIEGGWCNVVASAPDMHLLIAILGGGVGLVEALEGSVVTFVEVPVFNHGEVDAVHGVERDVQCVDGSL